MSALAEAGRRPTPRSIPVLLFSGLFLLYCATSSGGLEASDAELRFETAKSWVEGRGGALDSRRAWDRAAMVANGKVYAVYGPLQSVLMAPFIAASRLLPAGRGTQDYVARSIVALLVFPTLSALAIVVAYHALGRLGFPPVPAVLAVLTIGVATTFWTYARMGQEEHLVALGFTLWLLGVSALESGDAGLLPLSALGMSVAFATRWSAVPALAILAVPTAVTLWRRRQCVRLGGLAWSGVLLVVPSLAVLAYNYARFGNPFETGYGLFHGHSGVVLFSSRYVSAALGALLVSPYRGVFVYSPALILCLVVLLGRRPFPHPAITWAAYAVLAGSVVFFSFYLRWEGGFSWGPRFLVSALVLFAPVFAHFFATFRWRRWAPLLALSVVVQVMSVALPHSAEDMFRRVATTNCSVWACRCTAVCLRPPAVVRAVRNTITGDVGAIYPPGAVIPDRAVFESSDYRTLYWWPIRLSIKLQLFGRFVGLAVCAVLLAFAVRLLWTAYARAAAEVAAPAPG